MLIYLFTRIFILSPFLSFSCFMKCVLPDWGQPWYCNGVDKSVFGTNIRGPFFCIKSNQNLDIWSTLDKSIFCVEILSFSLSKSCVCAGSSQVVWRASWQLCLMPPPATPSQFNQEYWFKLSLQKKETNCPGSPWHCCCFCSECVLLSSNLMWQMWEKQLQGHLKLCVMLAAGAAVKRVLILTFFVEQPILLLLLPSCHEIPTLPERPKPPNCHFT